MYKAYGIDVSKHNGDIDFKKLKKDKNDFVIIRAGYGQNNEDPYFDINYNKAKQEGFKIGVYWYGYALNQKQAEKEALKCIQVIKGKKLDYPVFYDMEDADGYKDKNGMPTNTTLVNICKKFCGIVEKNGYKTGVYASESWFNTKLKKLKEYDKWVAKWGVNDGKLHQDLSKSCKIHQFTSKYRLNGKVFDRNISYYEYGKKVIKKPDTNKSIYFKKYCGTSQSIVDSLKSMKIDSSFQNRKKIAKNNGIKSYIGSSIQNKKLLTLLKKGKLKK